MVATTQEILAQRGRDGRGSSPLGGGARHALGQLLEGFASRLNVDLAALILRDERLRVRYISHEQASKNAVKLLDQFEIDLDYWLKAARNVLVQNIEQCPGTDSPRLNIACKLVVAPMSVAKQRVEGIAVIVNPPSGRDFSSRDKTLVQSLATTAADIVRVHFDPATGLMTRKEFEVVLGAALTNGQASTTRHALLHLDLDELGNVDQSLGREARDEVIRHVALQLDQHTDSAGSVGRIGEDEFVVLLRDCTLERGFCVAQEIRRAIGALSIVWHDEPIKITASVGVTQLIPGIGTRESALAAARIACITAKERGRDRVKAFQHDDAIRLNDRRREKIVARIQHALQDGRFLLYSQVIKPLAKQSRTRHIEILLRGLDDDNEPVPPTEFISYAEQSRIMPEIDRWVVQHTLEALADCRAFAKWPDTVFSMNLSGQSLCDDGFLDFVVGQLARTRVPPRSVCFEITETAAILNMARATRFMSALMRYGSLFSLDDFGAGLSSFSYLRTLPVNFLKIDGQFIREIVNDPVCSAMVSAINEMSHAMGLETIAEYVETPAIRKHLSGLGIDYGQGDSIASPEPFADALEALAR